MTTATKAATPCRVCGVATTDNLTAEVAYDHRNRPAGEVVVGVCPGCVDLRPTEPGAAVRALLRLVGRDEADWPLMAEALADEGVDCAPVLKSSSGRDRRVPGRAWAHVPGGLRRAARDVYARRVLLDRVHASTRKDLPVPPHASPDGTGCLACGVALSGQWHGPTTTGAYTRARVVTGFVCSTCEPHLSAAAAHGQSFLERAVLARFGKEWSEDVRLPRLRAWASLDLPPQAEPWSWVTELREPEPEPTLADALRAVEALTARVEALEARP